MILFLDFDGVLHPSPNKITTEFSKLPLFEDWLRNHPSVRVVISSSWREVMSIEILKAIFSYDLQERIFDKCPVLPFDENETFWRYNEILEWIKLNNYDGQWIALDDASSAFPEKLPQLVACKQSVGLTKHVLDRLTEKLLICY